MTKIRILINSFSLALMICSRALTQLLDFPRSSVYVAIIAFFAIFLNSIKSFINYKKSIILLYVFLFFVLTILFCGTRSVTIEYLLYFIVFGLTSFLMPYCFDFKMVMRFIVLLGVVLLWPYLNIDYAYLDSNSGGMYENVASIFMDISYKILVFVITGMIVAIEDDNIILKIVASIIALAYMAISFMYGARGALLSVTIFMFIFWLIHADNKEKIRKRVLFGFIVILLTILLFPVLIKGLYSFLDGHGIEARSVERVYDAVMNNASMSEGRAILAKKARMGIMDSIVWGNGIGSFDNFSGIYPHNIILQLLYEGGLLLAVPILGIFVKGIITMISAKYNFRYKSFLLMLFCSGVIELFLSSHLWMSLFFWLFLGQSILHKKFKYNLQ